MTHATSVLANDKSSRRHPTLPENQLYCNMWYANKAAVVCSMGKNKPGEKREKRGEEGKEEGSGSQNSDLPGPPFRPC